jgi:multicomponent Na+:H+ antiporter subunit E
MILFLFWLLLTFNLNFENIITGIIISIFVARASYNILYDDNGFKFKFPSLLKLIKYSFVLLIEIYKASFVHIIRIIKKDCDPSIITVRLDITDPLLITIISNSITLTPGTITIDTDKNKLTILTIKDYLQNGNTIEENIKEKFERLFFERM